LLFKAVIKVDLRGRKFRELSIITYNKGLPKILKSLSTLNEANKVKGKKNKNYNA
jgi:hypothetical protein